MAVYDASGSAQTTTGSIASGNNKLTLTSALDFKNGQGIIIANAGAACAISAPTSFTITPTGTAGMTHYTYAVAVVNGNGAVTTAFSASTTTGNAILSATNYNAFTITSSESPQAYAVWRTATTGIEPLGFIGYFNCTSDYCKDTGLPVVSPPFGIPSSPPASPLGGIFVTTIVSGAGTTTPDTCEHSRIYGDWCPSTPQRCSGDSSSGYRGRKYS